MYGASEKDWRSLVALGLTADLLPVVSDVAVPISPLSKIDPSQRGKTPSRVNRDGQMAGIPSWSKHQATAAQVERWQTDRRLGICIQTRHVRAIDVDIDDPAVSASVRSLVELLVGDLPCRSRPNSGKLLLAFRMTGQFSKRKFRTETGAVEFLADGQQFIAHGTHTSGARYEWSGLDGGIPELSAPEFEVLWQVLTNDFAKADEIDSGARAVTSHEDEVRGLTREDISALLAVLDPNLSYDEWLRVGAAIHHESHGEWFELWDDWSQKGTEYPGGEELWSKWQSFGRNAGSVVTAGTLLHMAHTAARIGGVALHLSIDPPTVGDASGFDDVDPDAYRQVAVAAQQDAEVSAEAARKEREQKGAEAMLKWSHAIEASESIEELQSTTCKRIAADRSVGDIHRALLAEAVQQRLEVLGASVPVAVCRKLVAYRTEERREPTVLKKRPLTEFGNAERMLDRYGDNLMFVPEFKCWYIWSEKPDYRWRRASDVEIEHWAKETIRALAKESDEYQSDEDRGAFFEFCKISQQARMVKNMVTLASSEPRVCVPARELDKDHFLLGVRNGIVDLRTGALLPPDKNARITLIAGCDYDPRAKAPLFERTLSEVFSGDADLAEYMLRVFGYALLGNPTEDIMAIAFGNGANGKSTLINTVRKTFGGYARSAEASSFVSDGKSGNAGGAREDLVRLRGARLVYVNEPDENGELREGAVKSMTGGDTITARGLFAKDSVEIEPTWTVIMPTNHKPIIKGTDHGIWRRMVLIPFERNFENDKSIPKDPKREEKLLGEMKGVLSLLVQACLRYQRDGLVPPARVQIARDAYRSQMDLLAEWLDESCEVGPDFSCQASTLWGSWEQFAKNRGLLRYIGSSAALGRRLDTRFPMKKGTGGVRMRLGVRLKTYDDLFE